METLVQIVHIILSIAVIALILLQQGKGADAGASLGGGASAASGTVMGSAGSGNFMTRATSILITAFFATSLFMAYIAVEAGGSSNSVTDSLLNEANAPVTEVVIPVAEDNANSEIPVSE